MKMKCLAAVVVLCVCSAAFASFTPVGTYSVTLSQGNWSVTNASVGTVLDQAYPFYEIGGRSVSIEMHRYLAVVDSQPFYMFDWIVSGDDWDFYSILGGTPGENLTISIEGLNFAETSQAELHQWTTHLYYLGVHPTGQKAFSHRIPGDEPIDGSNLNSDPLGPIEPIFQRTPIHVFDTNDPNYAFNYAYGTPVQIPTGDGSVSLLYPDLFTPSGPEYYDNDIWMLHFGAGFVPEPTTILLMAMGIFGLIRRR